MHQQKNDDEPNGLVEKKNYEELASEGEKSIERCKRDWTKSSSATQWSLFPPSRKLNINWSYVYREKQKIRLIMDNNKEELFKIMKSKMEKYFSVVRDSIHTCPEVNSKFKCTKWMRFEA